MDTASNTGIPKTSRRVPNTPTKNPIIDEQPTVRSISARAPSAGKGFMSRMPNRTILLALPGERSLVGIRFAAAVAGWVVQDRSAGNRSFLTSNYTIISWGTVTLSQLQQLRHVPAEDCFLLCVGDVGLQDCVDRVRPDQRNVGPVDHLAGAHFGDQVADALR
jgi:hypothetical protein